RGGGGPGSGPLDGLGPVRPGGADRRAPDLVVRLPGHVPLGAGRRDLADRQDAGRGSAGRPGRQPGPRIARQFARSMYRWASTLEPIGTSIVQTAGEAAPIAVLRYRRG